MLQVRKFYLLIFMLLPLQAVAQQPEVETPHQVVERISRDVLSALEETRSLFSSDPQAFYDAIGEAVAPAVDFERMAYLVMDQRYYSRSTTEQRQRFVEVFRESLIETYARGLISVTDTNFSISEPDPDEAGQSTVDVEQTLSDGSDSIRVVYSMRRGSDGKWLLNNVIIEGINLGRTFRNQFAQLASRYSEDLDRVIANWSPEDVSG
jgi:phospholipid transport system substrate-binding protein